MVAHSYQWQVSWRVHGYTVYMYFCTISYFNVVVLSNDLFVPDIIIPGAPTAENEFSNITCRLDGVVERLVDMPTVILSFINPPGGVSGDQSRDGLAYIRPHFFNPVTIDDIGNYTCIAQVISPSGGFFRGVSSEILQIQSNITIIIVH